VVLERDRAARTLALADREILVECRGTLDRRSVGASGLVNVVSTAISCDGAEVSAS